MHKFILNIILLISPIIFFVACNNDHCDESMYAPLRICLYAETDTSKAVYDDFLSLKGVGSDSLYDLFYKTEMTIDLNPLTDFSSFVWFKIDRDRVPEQISYDETSGEIFFDGQKIELKKYYSSNIANVNDEVRYLLDGYAYYTKSDTLNIEYERCSDFVSGECGYLTTYSLNKVWFSVDIVGEPVIKREKVTNLYNERHINIYIKGQ